MDLAASATAPIPFRPIADLIRDHASARLERIAVRRDDERLSYAAFDALIKKDLRDAHAASGEMPR